jgi:hypothetical protein
MRLRTTLALGSVILVLAIICWMVIREPRTLAGLRFASKHRIVFANDDWTVWATFTEDWQSRNECGAPYYNSKLYLKQYGQKKRTRIPGFVDYKLIRNGHRSGIDWVFSNQTVVHHEGHLSEGRVAIEYVFADGREKSWLLRMPEHILSFISQSLVAAASDSGAVVALDGWTEKHEKTWLLFVVPWTATDVAPGWATNSVQDGITNTVIDCSHAEEIISLSDAYGTFCPYVQWKGDWIVAMCYSAKVFLYNVVTKEKCFVKCPLDRIHGIFLVDPTTILVNGQLKNEQVFIINLPEKRLRLANPNIDGTNVDLITKIPSHIVPFSQRGRILSPWPTD